MSRYDHFVPSHIAGFPMTDVLEILRVMEQRDLKNAKQLEAAMPPERLEVVDAENPKRVLGTVHRQAVPLHSPRVRLAVLGGLFASSPYERVIAPTADISSADFEVAYQPHSGGALRVAQLRTSTSLDTLMGIRDFRLPGETARRAKERLYRSAYGG
ncbi:hypothetical protein EJV44_15430 [Ancylobacter aquaticus]|nr:hypothetical protein EJV44_15430 [Ancylobacter aquaticus]